MKKRILPILLCLTLLLALLPVPALAASGVEYIDAAYNEDTGQVDYSTQTVSDYTEVDSSTTTWSEGWYVVNSNVTITGRITVTGEVHLILADGCTLNASKGVTVNSGNSLTIYGQADGTGKLTTGTPDSNYAGIGSGGSGRSGGPITINGGVVNATGGGYAAGIGGGDSGAGPITINGGTVKATGGQSAAGIGSGFYGGSSAITIHGGTVEATGGEKAAGIGSGFYGGSSAITISGGTVTATGGQNGAGIGGSYYSGSPTITISGGTVKAAGGLGGAGIGGGWLGSSGDITISGGFVAATAGANKNNRVGAGIGSGAKMAANGTSADTNNFSNCVVMTGAVSAMTGTVYGSPTLTTDATVPSGATLTVPEDSTLTIYKDVTLTNDGTITNNGAIWNGGTIINNGTITGNEVQNGVFVDYQAYDNGEFTKQNHFAIPVTSDMITLGAGWYVVNSAAANDLKIANRITVSGDVHLILVDGKTLTASAGINVPEGSSLTIYGQTNGTGKLTTGTPDNGEAGIGGNRGSYQSTAGNCGPITINGGTVTATGGSMAAGIGGGLYGTGTVTIHGGTVTAKGGDNSAGIGGGNLRPGYVTITGGVVNATGGTWGAGIGGGYAEKTASPLTTVTISGGTVTAKGGASGAGIGTGNSGGSGSSITITGGFVTATGGAEYKSGSNPYGAGAAIGSGGKGGGSTGAEVEESNFNNAVVLKQSGVSGSTMTGQSYGDPTLTTDATVPTGATLTIPESTSLTVGKGTTLTNSGTIYVDATLTYGSTSYGTLTNKGTIYYHLTVDGGSATAGTTTYDSKTYAQSSASVTVAGADKVGQTFNNSWTTNPDTVTVTDNTFTMPAQPLTVMAGYTNTPSYTVTIPASITIGDTASTTIKAESVNVAEGYNLNVKLTATSDENNAFTLALKDHETETLGYTITQGEGEVEVGDTVLTVAGGTENNSGSSTLTFTMASGQLKKYSGTYTGTVTFTVSVAAASTTP